ncbi:DUF3487 family protein [Pseudoalteromonas luteoviolacea]|uniref:Conjugal transfer protein n=1 Tax=Pseudoalteromonas luteoviolacea S4060-1 TaxID=1365257 RepID=A0A167KW33_9GAMM|nr:DUF3487 family protein [Pseudoalteromonas luteoviolacea]KZN63380.1 hypothetical protein N478_03765 [Pseudoalteromonas luteoviolacea S4060-1]
MSDNYTDDFVPTFLNTEPEVILNLTETELGIALGGSVLFGVLISIPFSFFLPSFMAILLIYLASFGLGLYLFSLIFKRYKFGKPRGFFVATLKKKFGGSDEYYVIDKPLIVGRTNKKVVEYD